MVGFVESVSQAAEMERTIAGLFLASSCRCVRPHAQQQVITNARPLSCHVGCFHGNRTVRTLFPGWKKKKRFGFKAAQNNYWHWCDFKCLVRSRNERLLMSVPGTCTGRLQLVLKLLPLWPLTRRVSFLQNDHWAAVFHHQRKQASDEKLFSNHNNNFFLKKWFSQQKSQKLQFYLNKLRYFL